MSETNDQLSDTSSELNWPLDAELEGHQYDRVVFENVADQYVKDENVTAFFTILQDIKVNPDEDQIGLLRIGSTNIQECLAYANVQFNPSTASSTVRHGTAVFPSSSIPVTDDEFYQFCYVLNKTKNLGSSIPFQLNCAPDDIDLLSNIPVRKAKADGLIALADQDNDDLVVIHTKRMLTEEKLRQENRQLLDINRRLELQREEYLIQLETTEVKQKELQNKLLTELQALIAARKSAVDEATNRQQSETKLRIELDNCRSLCTQYQTDALQYAERCRTFEEAQMKITSETNQIRNQLVVQSQFTKDQATQIVDLERRLMQADELNKTANQRQSALERQLRDYRLTSEKHQMSMQGQIDEFSRQKIQYEDQIRALETTNQLLKEELVIKSGQENELIQNELELLRTELNEKKNEVQAYAALKLSYKEIEKRCLKYQKGELEAKRQLAAYQNAINDLEREVKDLTERLAGAADEYKALYRNYNILKHSKEIDQIPVITKKNFRDEEEEIESILLNTQPNPKNNEDRQQQSQNPSIQASLADLNAEVRQCPVCGWDFPENFTVNGKRDHIESHFD